MKAFEIMKKNLKVFIRDKQAAFMILFIPILFYFLMGIIFGAGGAGNIDISRYTVGYINMDLNSDDGPINTYQNIETIVTTIQNASETDQSIFSLENYTIAPETQPNWNESFNNAEAAMIDEEISAILVFEQGFQAALNQASVTKIGFYNNDTSVYNGTEPYFYTVDALYGLLQNMNYQLVNLTVDAYNTAINSFAENAYDYFLVVENGYQANIETSEIYLTFYHKEEINPQDIEIEVSLLNQTISNFYASGSSTPDLRIESQPVLGSGGVVKPSYSLYFLQSTGTTTKTMIEQTMASILSGIINYDPNNVEFNSSIQVTSGVALSQLTYLTPGYLLYGMMNVLSFGTVILTQEVKEGQLRRLRSSRMTDTDLFMGNMMANTVLIFIQLAVGLGILSIMGFSPNMFNWGTLIVGCFLNTLVFSLFINSLGLSLVTVFKSPEAAGGGVWIFLIPLMMFSGVFFPIELMSAKVAQIVAFLPSRMGVLAFQAVMIDALPLSSSKFWINILGQLGYGIALSLLGIRLFKNLTKGDGLLVHQRNGDKKKKK